MYLLKNTIIIAVLIAIHGYTIAQCANEANIFTFEYDGKSYEIVKENLNWINAAACAVERGGMLVEIDDIAEQNALFSELMNNANIDFNNTIAPDGGNGSYVWLGGNDLEIEGNWVWDGDNNNISSLFWMGMANGVPVGGLYSNWGDEPDDFFGQDALAISLNGWPLGLAGQWNDVNHDNTLYYVIEHPTLICNSTSASLNQTACDSYSSPSGNFVWTTSGTYFDTILNNAGCDSILTINLSINSVSDRSITIEGNTLMANNSSATYQWIDCDNNMAIIDGQTSQAFSPESNGNYAVQLSENGCDAISDCVAFSAVSITRHDFEVEPVFYPNPTKDFVTVDLGLFYENINITVLDLLGRKIQHIESRNKQFVNLKLGGDKGVYLVQVSSNEKRASFRLIKE